MSRLNLELTESELKIILESLSELQSKFLGICDSSDDEDEIADYGNDLIEVRLLLNSLKEKSIEKFGSQILNFSREQL
jgi:hypothetical protein